MAAAAGTKQEILERLRLQESQLRSLGIRRLGLFGSFVRQDESQRSDVDLLVEFEPGRKSFDSFMALAWQLEDLLQRPVELVTTEGLSPYLGPRILSEVEDVFARR